ncbi:alanyl-tRNA editing protein [Pararhodospirillum oryzae]|uniref:Metal-dependent hydrolase n=1 Tax=Pararhodospirillum oryzae TaxID=478448 RepID=A0A512H6W4_9PROT|nr:hypothetical protein [Pararhodospirillum oryzae]GEO81171.1 hypothetical protein ROR02_13020 [Pararhodospirillum oryzae]
MRVFGSRPSENTKALHYVNETSSSARIIFICEKEDKFFLVTDQTPFHPEDYFWKDQPGDQGTLQADTQDFSVTDTLAWPIAKSGDLLLPDQVTLSRNDEAHVLVIAHVVEPVKGEGQPEGGVALDAASLVGSTARLSVDPLRRQALSAAHTTAHLMSLALNKQAAPFWKKEARPDSLGHPNLDATAIAGARVFPGRSEDTYRLGKSLRKVFDVESFVENLPAIGEGMNEQVKGWIDQASPVSLTGEDLSYGARRLWTSVVDGTEVSIPCGGTHVKALSEIGPVSITLRYDPDEKALVVVSEVLSPPPYRQAVA